MINLEKDKYVLRDDEVVGFVALSFMKWLRDLFSGRKEVDRESRRVAEAVEVGSAWVCSKLKVVKKTEISHNIWLTKCVN